MEEMNQVPLRGSKLKYQVGVCDLWTIHRACSTVPKLHHVQVSWEVTFYGCIWFADDPSKLVKTLEILRWYQL